MCLDTLISAGVGLGGAALSGQGAAQNAQAQAQQTEETAIDNELAAEASNRVLAQFLKEQGLNQDANQTALAPEYASIQQPAFEASRQGFATNDGAAAQNGIRQVLADQGPQIGLTGTDNGQSAAAIQKATAARTGLSLNDAQNYANLASYGRNFANLGLNEMNTNENIDTTNAKARSEAGILPTNEQNAALQARHFIPPADTSGGNTDIGLGNLLASNAGGIGTAVGKGISGLGSIFSSMGPSITNPTLTSGSGGIGMA